MTIARDPDRVSFTRSLNAARRSVRAGPGSTAAHLAAAFTAAAAEICRELATATRRLRAGARVVKRKTSNYGVKRTHHRSWPQPTRAPTNAAHILRC